MESLQNILSVFVGGGLGAVVRFILLQYRILDGSPYWSTMLVNISGCFLIGMLLTVFQSLQLPRSYYIICITGFLGGYTTYSAFTGDAMALIQSGMIWRGLLYIASTLIGGIGAYATGMFIARYLIQNE